MTDENAPRDEVAIAELDQRFASLRLVAPEELGRVRASIERMGILSPVLVATAVEATRVVLVDGFYADPSLMQSARWSRIRISDGPAAANRARQLSITIEPHDGHQAERSIDAEHRPQRWTSSAVRGRRP